MVAKHVKSVRRVIIIDFFVELPPIPAYCVWEPSRNYR